MNRKLIRPDLTEIKDHRHTTRDDAEVLPEARARDGTRPDERRVQLLPQADGQPHADGHRAQGRRPDPRHDRVVRPHGAQGASARRPEHPADEGHREVHVQGRTTTTTGRTRKRTREREAAARAHGRRPGRDRAGDRAEGARVGGLSAGRLGGVRTARQPRRASATVRPAGPGVAGRRGRGHSVHACTARGGLGRGRASGGGGRPCGSRGCPLRDGRGDRDGAAAQGVAPRRRAIPGRATPRCWPRRRASRTWRCCSWAAACGSRC